MKQPKQQRKNTNSPSWRNQAFAGFLLAALVIPILFLSDSTTDPTYLVRHLILSGVLLVALIAMLVVGRANGIVSRVAQSLKHPISMGLLLFLTVKVVSSFVAFNKVEAAFDILSYALGYIFFLVALALMVEDKNAPKTVASVVALLNGVLIGCGFYEFMKVGFDWEKMGEVGSVMTNQNLFAPMFFLCIPFLMMVREHHKYWKLFLLLIALDVAMVIVLQNRATYLALAVSALVYFGFSVFSAKDSDKNRGLQKAGFMLVSVAAFGIAVTQLNKHSDYWEILTDREARIHDNYNSTTERLQLWNRSTLLFSDHPVLGVGAGNWPLEIGAYGLTDPRSDEGSKYFLRPHNEFLKTFSETGIIGGVSLFIFVAIVLGQLSTSLSQYEKRKSAIIVLSALVGFSVISLLSFPMERVPLMVLVFLLLASISPSDETRNQDTKNFGIWLASVLLLFSTLAGYAYFQRYENDRLAKQMDDARNRKQWNRVENLFGQIDPHWYNVNYFRVPIGFYGGLVSFHQKRLDEAKTRFEKGLEANPNHILSITNLATCYQQLNQPEQAISYYKKALEVNPNFETARLNLAIAYYKQGQFELAQKEVLRCPSAPENVRNAISQAVERNSR